MMDLDLLLHSLIPSWTSASILFGFLAYLAVFGSLLPGKLIPGAVLADGSRLHYRRNGLLLLILAVSALGGAIAAGLIPPTFLLEEKMLELMMFIVKLKRWLEEIET